MSDVGGTNSKRARGMTLIEVMVAIVLLVLIFIFVGQNMVASSWATSKASQRSMDISAANYFMGVMYGDGSLWGTYPDSPKDPCGNTLTPVTDPGPMSGGGWHTPPTCNLAPAEVAQVQYQWLQTVPVEDSSDLTVWVRSTIDGKVDTYEMRGHTHSVPTQLTLATPPPSPTPTPTPTPTGDADPQTVADGHADAQTFADRDAQADRDAESDADTVTDGQADGDA